MQRCRVHTCPSILIAYKMLSVKISLLAGVVLSNNSVQGVTSICAII